MKWMRARKGESRNRSKAVGGSQITFRRDQGHGLLWLGGIVSSQIGHVVHVLSVDWGGSVNDCGSKLSRSFQRKK